MKQVVIMPGGFHPFHAGHYALYQQALKAFPNADVYVAATADLSTRPFPFQIKQKLAKLAGVPGDRFVQVKSPFSAEEITNKYDPDTTAVIFVRSEKDRGSPPQPAKRDAAGNLPLVTRGPRKGQPVSDYLQYYTGPENLQPKSQHIYIDYLPTVEFGPGMTSATEIRKAWPGLNDRRKTALVMSLYPRTQGNAKLANTVVKMLDMAIGSETNNAEVKESTNPRIDLTPNFPNYTRLVGEFVGTKNNKLLFNIVDAELKSGAKPTEKIDRAMTNRTPIAMAVNYVKNRQVVDENDYEHNSPGVSESPDYMEEKISR